MKEKIVSVNQIKMRDPQGKIWLRIKKEKIKEFERLGIMTCEMCDGTGTTFEHSILDMSHSRKRKDIQNEEQMAEVCLLCRHHHNFVEYKLNAEERLKLHQDIIKRREGIDTMFDL